VALTAKFPAAETAAHRIAEKSSSAHERLVFMDFRCTFLGEIRRADLMARFGVGSAAATRDLAHYKGALGGKIQMDPVTKVYRPSEDFKPVFHHDVGRALTALSQGFGESQLEITGALLPSEVPPRLSVPSIDVLASISRAINLRQVARITYSSFSSGKQMREIVPFALADNGLRWHVRAFDRRGERFVDFVLTRIHSIDVLPDSPIRAHEQAQHDLDWSRVLELELVPHPKEAHKEVIEMDYPMSEGVLKVRVRAALASYLLRQWLVDCSLDHSLTGPEYRLWLRNTPILYGIANAQLAPGYIQEDASVVAESRDRANG
jgi:predicted DNA-binding transcriptional regulator YafY